MDGQDTTLRPGAALAGLATIGLACAWYLALVLAPVGDGLVLLPVVIAGVAAGSSVLAAGIRQRRWALIGLLVTAVAVLNLSFRVRELGSAGLDPQNGFKMLVWVTLCVVSMANWPAVLPRLRDPAMACLLGYGVVAVLSALWSPVPAYSVASGIGFVGYVLFSCLAAERLGERTVLLAGICGLTGYLAIGLVAAAVAPDFAFMPPYGEKQIYRLQGLSGHPNSLAKQVSVLLFLVVAACYRGFLGRRATLALLALGFATLWATNSRTALLGVLAAWGLYELRRRRLLSTALALLATLAALLAVVAATGLGPDLDDLMGAASRTGDASEVLTLTGRTELWGLVWDMILRSPVLGYGFNAFEATMVDLWFGNPDASAEAHNTLLQCLFTLGLLGTVPMLGCFAILVRRMVRRPAPLRDLMLIFLIVTGISEADITGMPVALTIAFCLAIAVEARPAAQGQPRAAALM